MLLTLLFFANRPPLDSVNCSCMQKGKFELFALNMATKVVFYELAPLAKYKVQLQTYS